MDWVKIFFLYSIFPLVLNCNSCPLFTINFQPVGWLCKNLHNMITILLWKYRIFSETWYLYELQYCIWVWVKKKNGILKFSTFWVKKKKKLGRMISYIREQIRKVVDYIATVMTLELEMRPWYRIFRPYSGQRRIRFYISLYYYHNIIQIGI